MTETDGLNVPAIRFRQWLSEWNKYDFDPKQFRKKPEEFLYVFSMKAAQLRQLSDVYRRTREGNIAEGIQRKRDDSRTARIQRYVHYGYPYGDLRPDQQTDGFAHLRKPGWLPTAIVVNFLQPGDERHGAKIAAKHVIGIKQLQDNLCELIVPSFATVEESELAPIEVIDGQHRLWSFDDADGGLPVPDDFELPVVAYRGLDIAWQAYLFWSINVSPKRINPSHAFDLYPLLRTQDWLEQAGDLRVYREARAQEIAECLYVHPMSPWVGRINMLGEKGSRGVSQAAWVRGLMSTFLSTGQGSGRMGLFQSKIPNWEEPLEWSRGQQSAFLIQFWIELREQIASHSKKYLWIRKYGSNAEAAFSDRTSMLNQDMGVRAVLSIVNDIYYENADSWRLVDWRLAPLDDDASTVVEETTVALRSLKRRRLVETMHELAASLAAFDWRSLEGPEMEQDEDEQVRKRSYRGSGGYAALRNDVLKEIAAGRGAISRTAASLLS